MRRIRAAAIGVVLAVAIAPGEQVRVLEEPARLAVETAADADARLIDRLQGLDPDDHEAYFELAEEVVSRFPDSDGYRLARELYALSYAIGQQDARVDALALARSVALATAEITPDPIERRWLLTMAQAKGQSATSVGEVQRERLEAAEALSRHRAGDYRRVRPILFDLDLERVLKDVGVSPLAARDVSARVENDARTGRDEDRLTPGRPREGEFRPLNPANGGNPGPGLSAGEFTASLRAEMVLLRAEPESWAADLLMRENAPARDLDPAELLVSAGVQAGRTKWSPDADGGWRRGSWVVQPARDDG